MGLVSHLVLPVDVVAAAPVDAAVADDHATQPQARALRVEGAARSRRLGAAPPRHGHHHPAGSGQVRR